MRFLITGGLGFLGARIGEYLSNAGHQIVLGTRHKSNPPDWLRDAEVVQTKWDDVNALQEVCKGVDVVIHAAGMNAKDCAEDPVAALAFNGVATSKLVEGANRSGVKKFIYLSTAHVYGSPLVGNITEETILTNSHPYATSHVAGEQALLSTSNNGGMQGIVLRLSNAFGKPMDSGANCWMLLVNDLCRQVMQTGQLTLKTNGLQKRDFLAVAEVCEVIEQFSIGTHDFKNKHIFNVGAGVSKTVKQMADLIKLRCEVVLNIKPKINVENRQINHDVELPLIFVTDRLREFGIKCSDHQNISEIDKLLSYCQLVFSVE